VDENNVSPSELSAPPEEPPPAKDFPIVGIGASAGGLSAFEAFLSAMPFVTEKGIAFVLVQHLSPDHKSILTELVKRYTRMQVQEVEDGVDVRPNCVYIIPPNHEMAIIGGQLQLLEPSHERGVRLTIDYFFRSLAADQRHRAIGIILSGTGSDGALGLRAIKGEGGMIMAQEPSSTEFDGMPRSAIATGLVDFILPPDEMPAQLIAYVSRSFGEAFRKAAAVAGISHDAIAKICVLLRANTGHDFSQYKESTIVRRVERRMALHQIERPQDYVRYLQQSRDEADALFRDLLIGVTSFFRDPAFTTVEELVIPRLFASLAPESSVRVWVCGCSTGEEAYTWGMLFDEHLKRTKQAVKVQIFATDIDRRATDQARSGVFHSSIAADVSPERLERHFSRLPDGSYRIHKAIRDRIIFSEQDVLRDPPFSRLHVISCRNLLIYLNTQLQKRLIPLFHYALQPNGILFLGNSETIGDHASLFDTLDRKARVYVPREEVTGGRRAYLEFIAPGFTSKETVPSPAESDIVPRLNFRALSEQALLRHAQHVGVLVNSRGEILYFSGRTGKYLETPSGNASANIFTMAREGLRRELTAAMQHAITRRETLKVESLRADFEQQPSLVDVTILPIPHPSSALVDLFFVLFEERPVVETLGAVSGDSQMAVPPEVGARIAILEHELRTKEEYIHTIIEEMATSSEELKSSNEELQSMNEEMQSTNEELETSKEELQSVNEELATVNAELNEKVLSLSRANNDLDNLMAGTGVGTLFVDNQLRISRFTPSVTQVIHLIPSDVGRPLAHTVSNFSRYGDLVRDVQRVLERLVPMEFEAETNEGRWYLLGIRPYRRLDKIVEGAVITFVEITERKRREV
jgi:two-component system CheB/CheR fusion protein